MFHAGFHRIPWSLLCCILILMGCGLAGIARGDELAGQGHYFQKQCVWILISLTALAGTILFPYRNLRSISYPLFLTTLILLIAVFFIPAVNGSRRWIPLGFFKFQPSELAKITYILALAHYLMYRKNYRRIPGLIVPFILTCVPVILILREPDLGTSLLFFPILFAMLFTAGARPRHLITIVTLGICMLPLLWLQMNPEQKSRIVALFTQRDGGEMPRGDGYHLYQSKQMLALGGVWGSEIAGMPVDDPAAYHLPAGRTDFIFCLVGERFGIVGCLFALAVFSFLFIRGLQIALATREPFGRLVAVGIVTLLASQTIINTGMTVGLMPITGMTLPLMSYGGTSMLSTCLALGLLINICMHPGYEIHAEPFRF